MSLSAAVCVIGIVYSVDIYVYVVQVLCDENFEFNGGWLTIYRPPPASQEKYNFENYRKCTSYCKLLYLWVKHDRICVKILQNNNVFLKCL